MVNMSQMLNTGKLADEDSDDGIKHQFSIIATDINLWYGSRSL